MPQKKKSNQQQQSKMERQPKMWNVMAQPGAGKTTLLIDLAERKLKSGGRVLIIDPDGAEPAWDKYPRLESFADLDPNFKGAIVIDFDEKQGKQNGTFEHLWKELIKPGRLRNFTLILDDPNVYAKDRLIPELTNLLRRKRQHNYDIVTTSHGWGETPKAFVRFIDIWIIGPTSMGAEDRKDILGPAKVQLHNRYKIMADRDSMQAKQSGRNHKWIAFDKDGNQL